MKQATDKNRKSFFDRFIDGIEFLGNKLPHPFWLFTSMIAIVLVLSMILSMAGVEVTYLQAAKSAGEAPIQVTMQVNNLLSKENIQSLFTNFTTIYAGFAPLSLVIIMMLGVGMLEQTGMISALIRKSVLGAPVSLIFFVVAFAGVNANLASDAGIIIVPAVTAAVFKSLGYNPWVGIIAAYAAANGGFTANIFIAGTDVLTAGITESVTTSMGIDAPVHPMMNYYFMVASCFVIVFATVLVTKFYTVKRHTLKLSTLDASALEKHQVTPQERKGLKNAGITALVYLVGLIAICIPKTSLFRNGEGEFFPKSPILSSIIPLLFFFFFALSCAYGRGAKTITKFDDIPKLMQKGVSSAVGFIVIALPASIFIHLFGISNISTIIGVKGSEILQRFNFTGFPLLIAFIVVTTMINLFIGSGSAKWLLLAPVFIPMFASLGYSPALTQITYRIADTCTNIISPMDYYLPVIMGLLVTYNPYPEKEKIGLGTVISMCMPYSIVYLISLTLLLFVWFVFALPIGPGCAPFM